MTAIRHLLSARFALWGLAVMLALFGVGNIFVALFYTARYEVIYQFSVTVSHCFGEQCAFSAMLEVANSGSETQEELVVKLTGLPARVGASPTTFNLDATLPRSSDPEITQRRDGDVLEIRLLQFSPGALTQFQFSGFVPVTQTEKASHPKLEIEGRGRMIEADPRGLAFARWFTARKPQENMIYDTMWLFV